MYDKKEAVAKAAKRQPKEKAVCIPQSEYDNLIKENAYLKGFQEGKTSKNQIANTESVMSK